MSKPIGDDTFFWTAAPVNPSPQSDLDELTGRTTDGVSRVSRYLAAWDVIPPMIASRDHEGEKAAFLKVGQLYGELTEKERWEATRYMDAKFAGLSDAYARSAAGRAPIADPADPRPHPCAECGVLRTKSEGGAVFTICDGCWDALHPKEVQGEPQLDVRRVVKLRESVIAAFGNYSSGSGLAAKQLAAEVPALLGAYVQLGAMKRAGFGVEEIKRLDAENEKLRDELVDVTRERGEALDRESALLQKRDDLQTKLTDAKSYLAGATAKVQEFEADLGRARCEIKNLTFGLAQRAPAAPAAPPPATETQASISQWADGTFGPAGSNARAVARANREMSELLEHVTTDDRHPEAAEEVADIVIVLYRVATRLGVDLHGLIDEKMATNRARKWRLDGTGHGYHVKEPTAAEDAEARKLLASDFSVTGRPFVPPADEATVVPAAAPTSRKRMGDGPATPRADVVIEDRPIAIDPDAKMVEYPTAPTKMESVSTRWSVSDAEVVDRVVGAVLDCYDGSDLWVHARRDPEAFRGAVRRAMGLEIGNKEASDGAPPVLSDLFGRRGPLQAVSGRPGRGARARQLGRLLARAAHAMPVVTRTAAAPACPTCGGDGYYKGARLGDEPCRLCKGTGTVDRAEGKLWIEEAGTEIRRSSWLAKIEALKAGDLCEFHYPARKEWLHGVVVENGGSGYWTVRDETDVEDRRGCNTSLHIELIRLPGQEEAWR